MKALRLLWRAEQRNSFALVAAVDTEIGFVNRQHSMPGKEFAHPNDAQVSQVWAAISIANRQIMKLLQMTRAIVRNPNGPAF